MKMGTNYLAILGVTTVTTVMSCTTAKKEYMSYELYPVRTGSLIEMEYTPEATKFTLWSPTADEVRLMLYEAGEGGHAYETVKMQSGEEGTWTAVVSKDLIGKFYTFNVKIDDKWQGDTPGINARAVGVNGKRAAIIDWQSTNPDGWESDTRPPLKSPADMIIYEMHHRDFSVDSTSGVKNKGKYLALTEHGTMNSDKLLTGIDHLIELGVTHVHLLPSFDYASVDETRLNETERKAKVGAETEYGMVSLLFDAFCAHTGKMPRWGMLTGIHPIKLLRQLTEQHGEAEAARLFREKYFVSNEKTALAVRTLRAQKPITDKVRENDYSLYISVPFCPTRCAYCSFVSQSVEKAKKQIPEYHRLLLEELKETAKVADALGLNLRAVYVGGGTPTTFSAEQLSEMIRVVKESFDMSQCEELTVEAGRPDTIDRAKLDALLKSGVSRISINPQTLQDNVLENIGRRHTAQQTVDAFHLAREAGFTNINMDLIVGLPGDTYETFCDTIEKVIALDPENVTVHALALKRSSFITQSGEINKAHADAALADRMMAYAEKRLTERGLEPYYLYRQSRMAGNLENTGWAKPGTECAYNIFTMDETETVLACGAGGVTKLKNPYSEDLSRIFNFKYSYEYISRYPEILERKEGIAKQYEQFRKRLH